MKSVSEAMRDYLQTHPYDIGDPEYENILDLLYRAYAETHESDPPEIQRQFGHGRACQVRRHSVLLPCS